MECDLPGMEQPERRMDAGVGASVRIAPRTLEDWDTEALAALTDKASAELRRMAQHTRTLIAHVRELRRELSRGRSGW